jgi:cell division septation protein DedD
MSAEATVAPTTAEAKPAAEPANAQPDQPREPAPAPAPAPKILAPAKSQVQTPKTPSVQTAPSSYAINVGVFAEAANAERVLAQLKAARLPAYTQQIEGAKGPLTRVRVGPFGDSEQAGAAAQRIRALGLDAVVFRP